MALWQTAGLGTCSCSREICLRVELSLKSRLHDIKRTCHRASKTACSSAGKEFQLNANFSTLLPLSCPILRLLVEHELESREGEIPEKGCFITMEQGREALLAVDGSCRINGAPIIVTGMEKWIIMSALEL